VGQQKQALDDCTRYLQSVFLSGAPTCLIFDLLVRLSDAENQASGLTVRTIVERTRLSPQEALRGIRGIASFTGDDLIQHVDGDDMWLYQTYEPRSIGHAAMATGKLIRKAARKKARQAGNDKALTA